MTKNCNFIIKVLRSCGLGYEHLSSSSTCFDKQKKSNKLGISAMLQRCPAEVLPHQWKAKRYLWKMHLAELHFIEFKTKIDQSGLGRRTRLLRFSDVSTVFTLKDQKRWGKETWKGKMFFSPRIFCEYILREIQIRFLLTLLSAFLNGKK